MQDLLTTHSDMVAIFQWLAFGGVVLLSVILWMVHRHDQRLMRLLRETVQQRERLTTAIEQSAETVLVTDPDGRIEYVNPAFERITGYTPAEAIGKTPRILKSGQHPDAFYREMWQTLKRGDIWTGRVVNKRKDGSLYIEEASMSPVRDARGQIVNFVATKRDVTHEIELESQQQQALKMKSVGRLAGGVAHEFNNMLQAILGHAEIAVQLIEMEHPVREDVQAIIVAAKRSADLTRQLLGFAQKQSIQPRILDLNETVSNTLKLLQQSLGEHITMVWKPGDGLWPVAMDPVQIDQILVNLCVNARDAIEKDANGLIEISTRNIHLEPHDASLIGALQAGDYITLVVRDNGAGMDASTREHVFEPFFTTKKMGYGTGLGLATTYGIIQQNKGAIEVESDPGHGTVFTIYLPRRQVKSEDLPPEAPSTPDDTAPTVRTATILVVEDEPSGLYVARTILERAGHRVLAAATPGDALRLASENDEVIDVLLTDVIMPEINGADLARRLLVDRPKLTCIFMSGYTAEFLDRDDMIKDGMYFIQKPFSAAELNAKINAVLQGNSSGGRPKAGGHLNEKR